MLFLVAATFVSACTPVSPWQRGNLAKPQMSLDPYPMETSLRAHDYGSREAASGTSSGAGGGGGCGCY